MARRLLRELTDGAMVLWRQTLEVRGGVRGCYDDRMETYGRRASAMEVDEGRDR